MDYNLLLQTYHEELEKLDFYFHQKLLHEPRALAELEAHKDDLLQDLFYYLSTKHRTATYRDYEPIKFIWIKAEMIWIKFIRKLTKQANREVPLTADEFSEYLCCENFLEEFEVRDWLSSIEKHLQPDEIKLLQFRAQGYTYQEIANMEGYTSENAVKTKCSRLRVNIRHQFGHF